MLVHHLHSTDYKSKYKYKQDIIVIIQQYRQYCDNTLIYIASITVLRINNQSRSSTEKFLKNNHRTKTVLRPSFRDHLREPVPEESFLWTLWTYAKQLAN